MKKTRINAFRVALSSAVLCGVMGAMLLLQATKVHEILQKIVDNGKLDNLEQFAKYVTYCLPVIVAAIMLTLIYAIWKADDKAVMHKEKAIATVAMALLTYAVLLPIVASKKEPIGESEKTLLEKTIVWFVFQAVPMLVMILYHVAMNDGSEQIPDACESTHEEKEEK